MNGGKQGARSTVVPVLVVPSRTRRISRPVVGTAANVDRDQLHRVHEEAIRREGAEAREGRIDRGIAGDGRSR
jgi:hypothetical protein